MNVSTSSEHLWANVVIRHHDYQQAVRDFLADLPHRIEPLRAALRGPARMVALQCVSQLSVDERKALFPEWVHLARCQSLFETAQSIITGLPREWVSAHLETEVDRILKDEQEDDYWMFLQLYRRYDVAMMGRLARRAAVHQNPDIRELGVEYLDLLTQPTAAS